MSTRWVTMLSLMLALSTNVSFASGFLCIAQCSQVNPANETVTVQVVINNQVMATGADAATAFANLTAKCTQTLNVGSQTDVAYTYNDDTTSDLDGYLENAWLEAKFVPATADNACLSLE